MRTKHSEAWTWANRRSIVAAKHENDQLQGRLIATQDPDAAHAVSTGL
jgi:hypothetical protein